MARIDKIEIVFDYPVQVGDKELTFVTMRRQLVQDAIDAETMASGDSGAEQEVAIFSLLCSVPMEDMRKWDFRDYQKLQAGYVFLMGSKAEDMPLPSGVRLCASPAGQDGAEQKSEE